LIKKKDPAVCDDRALKAETKNTHALYSAPAFQSQILYIQRRFGVAPIRAELLAVLCFGERP
jgi:hypothetical protein